MEKGKAMANINEATRQFLAAREAAQVAAAALATAEAALKEQFTRRGVDTNTIDGQKVMIVRAERAKYDTETLLEIVPANIADTVTKVEIDAKKFRAAIELGIITDEVAEQVTTITQVEAVRVYDIATGEAEAAKAPAKKKAPALKQVKAA